MEPTPEYLLEIARQTAWGAADIVLDYYKQPIAIEEKLDGPVTTADIAADRFILEQLRSEFGTRQFAYLSEETIGGGERFDRPLVWVIDPIDGTRDFIDGTGEFAVHIALVEEGRPILGAVAWPVRECVYFARKGGGAFVEDRAGRRERIRVSEVTVPKECRIIVSRAHRDWRLDALLARLPKKEQIIHGGLGCKLCSIAAGEAEVYIGLSGKTAPRDWDLAAPQLVLEEAGGTVSRFDSEPLIYNRADMRLWGGLIASNGLTHARWCAQLPGLLEQVEQAGPNL
ncbi:3'(2'),5'-bisphosphate nucleotidase CysQ family protein [Gloeobacter kilaueensis]|uniref:inositol-phosphate phosphatase n=1 Tax=Gloeobacter kilaueensis (strain ATCC BAA-2537 / CCAP 1431/1 / ULC 316 / JS1) TaxID=1183438 RepID=U5QDN4_GLOK1|nr:3'(2'),5'-bisphosphate nucleotidase CysQ [Gloeobacter kilaueensis]AGY57016.1 3'(2'),5'-bisphosphate nucleotidase [Gloeobacter kilaueensis JS1]